MKNVCETTCKSDYNYHYRITYDAGRVSEIASSTRFTIEFDNGSRVKRIDTAPEAASGLIRSGWDQVSKFFGGLFGAIF
jgi:hypothetical protein